MRVHPYGNYEGADDQQHIIKKVIYIIFIYIYIYIYIYI